MSLNFADFFVQVFQNPTLLIVSILILGITLVNGFTDAPNAIATCVSTRSISPRKAILMAAICDFLGVVIMSLISKNIVSTIVNMVNFNGNSEQAILGLCSGLVAAILYAMVASHFGFPTSESHALIAGISGAAIAIQNGISGINFDEWKKVLYGLLLSSIMGFFIGYIITKIIEALFKNKDRRKTNNIFRKAQVISGAGMSFMHGAQDGQKFIGIFILGISLAGVISTTDVDVPIWLMILCSFFMSLGTSIGGMKIIKTVGLKMVKLEPYQGMSADLAGIVCLIIASIFGLPVSTTHTKTSAIMGVGASKRLSNVNWQVVKNMVKAWVFTFPICGLLGFVITKIFISIL